MPQAGATIEILSPVGRTKHREQVLAPRLDTLDGKIIAFLDNNKTGAAPILQAIEAALRQRYRLLDVVWRRKASPAAAADSALLDELAMRSHAVITAMGDCGSCTSWTLHDAVALESRGRPVAMLCTHVFEQLAASQARARGVSSYPLVVTTHPTAYLDETEVRDRVQAMMDDIIHSLSATTPTGAPHAGAETQLQE